MYLNTTGPSPLGQGSISINNKAIFGVPRPAPQEAFTYGWVDLHVRRAPKKKTRRPGAELPSDGFVFQLVEMPGVEPGSERTQNQASTCVAPLLNVAEHSAKGQGQCTAKVD